MSSLYIYFDESGNFDFTSKGTPFLLLCALMTKQPAITQQPLQELKYRFLETENDIENLHASKDSQQTRNSVFQSISNLKKIGFHYAYIDKRKINPKWHHKELMYKLLSEKLLRHCLSLQQADEADKIIVIFDKVFNAQARSRQKAFMKPLLAATNKTYYLYFHRIPF